MAAVMEAHAVGDVVLKADDVTVTFGAVKALTGVSFDVKEQEILAIIGPNGAGKTTLLRLMAGDLSPDQGNLKRAADLRVVTFSQHRGTLVPNQTLQQALCPSGDTVTYRNRKVHVAGWARRFLFEADQLSTYVES